MSKEISIKNIIVLIESEEGGLHQVLTDEATKLMISASGNDVLPANHFQKTVSDKLEEIGMHINKKRNIGVEMNTDCVEITSEKIIIKKMFISIENEEGEIERVYVNKSVIDINKMRKDGQVEEVKQ